MKINFRNLVFTLLFVICLIVPAKSQDNWIMVQGGAWIPGDEVMSDMKAKIEPFIARESKAQGRPITNLQEYSFQYQGREKNGKPYVFVNAICEVPKESQLDEAMVVVFDGGKCYFEVKYDKNKRKFYRLIINGEA